jgi:hypothetical protein
VARDPRELRAGRAKREATRKGRPVGLDGRVVLNAGHTIGHALEAASLRGRAPLRHGEAVALGLLAEARIGRALGLWPEGPARIAALLARLGISVPVEADPLGARDAAALEVVRGALAADKKRAPPSLEPGADASGDRPIRFVLLDGPGRPVGVMLDGVRALEILLGEKDG